MQRREMPATLVKTVPKDVVSIVDYYANWNIDRKLLIGGKIEPIAKNLIKDMFEDPSFVDQDKFVDRMAEKFFDRYGYTFKMLLEKNPSIVCDYEPDGGEDIMCNLEEEVCLLIDDIFSKKLRQSLEDDLSFFKETKDSITEIIKWMLDQDFTTIDDIDEYVKELTSKTKYYNIDTRIYDVNNSDFVTNLPKGTQYRYIYGYVTFAVPISEAETFKTILAKVKKTYTPH